jgi:uncharacterized protein
VGETRTDPKRLAEVDLQALRSKLGLLIEEAKASDPRVLRKRIADLERELARERAKPAAVERVEVQVVALPPEAAEWARRLVALSGELADVARAVDSARPPAPALAPPPPPAPTPSRASRPPVVVREDEPARRRPPASADDGEVSAPQQAILDALAWLESASIAPASRLQVAALAHRSPGSSGYANNLGRMRSMGLVDYPEGGMVALTSAGRRLATAPDVPPTTEALQGMVCESLGSRPRAAILNALIAAWPASLTREELAAKVLVSPGSSGFANNLGAMRSLGWLTYPSNGRVQASEVLFLERAS